jgi:lipopolysaccharide/colanic/teichoic acid biosynthesis glycosyltransferase
MGASLWVHEVQETGVDAPAVLTSLGKRALDVSIALVLIVALSPLWLVVALLIKLTSSGPVIFRQKRLGVGGRSFTLLKFRTMRDGSPDEVHRDFVTRFIRGDAASDGASSDAAYKLNGDSRITSVGRVLRKLSIDEFPQLLNVIQGEMSLVGPRPPLGYEVDSYQPWQMERLTARPGITGLWQVSGRNRLTHDEMCRLDIQYIRTWSLMKDIGIMLKTPWVMLVDGGGAG